MVIGPAAGSARSRSSVRLASLATAGTLVPVIGRTYSLGEVPDAIRHLRAGHVRGTLVVIV